MRFIPPLFRPLAAAPLATPSTWIGLAWLEIVHSYRRTILGPAWITLNLVIFTVAMTLVYGALFGVPTKEYAAYLLCGMMIWLWISALLNEVGNTFIQHGHFLKSIPMDKSILVWTAVHKQAIVFAHQLIVYAVMIVAQVISVNFYTLLAIPAVGILYLLSIPVTAMAAILFTRFRDLQRLVGSIMIVLLMVTPIFWQSHMVTGWRSLIVHLNPFYYIIEFVRAPLLGQLPSEPVIWGVIGMTAAFWIVGSIMYRRYERFVIFWL